MAVGEANGVAVGPGVGVAVGTGLETPALGKTTGVLVSLADVEVGVGVVPEHWANTRTEANNSSTRNREAAKGANFTKNDRVSACCSPGAVGGLAECIVDKA